MNESDSERLQRTQEFFAARAATWNAKFGDDAPAYAAAVHQAAIPFGCIVADVGCGTGRAFRPLRGVVGSEGGVIRIDATPQMLTAAAEHAHASRVTRLQADAMHLPLSDGSVDAVFAAGLINHLPNPHAAMRELARITRRPGRLILFHPTGRAALAARHGRELRADEPLASAVLGPMLAMTGWRLIRYDDAAHRFFALAHRAFTPR